MNESQNNYAEYKNQRDKYISYIMYYSINMKF